MKHIWVNGTSCDLVENKGIAELKTWGPIANKSGKLRQLRMTFKSGQEEKAIKDFGQMIQEWRDSYGAYADFPKEMIANRY